MGTGVRGLLRQNTDPYVELKLDDAKWTNDRLIDFMLQYPRPVVITKLGTRLCRPSEVVLDILPDPQKGAFTKEDGEQIVDANGQRIIK